jgi:hypothetical protein
MVKLKNETYLKRSERTFVCPSLNRAAIRQLKTCKDLQQSGLPRTRGAGDRNNLAAGN